MLSSISLLYYVFSYNVIYSYAHRCDRILLILRHGVSFTLKYLYFYAMHCNWYIDSINLSHVPLHNPVSSFIFAYILLFFLCFGQRQTLDSIYSVYKHSHSLLIPYSLTSSLNSRFLQAMWVSLNTDHLTQLILHNVQWQNFFPYLMPSGNENGRKRHHFLLLTFLLLQIYSRFLKRNVRFLN